MSRLTNPKAENVLQFTNKRPAEKMRNSKLLLFRTNEMQPNRRYKQKSSDVQRTTTK